MHYLRKIIIQKMLSDRVRVRVMDMVRVRLGLGLGLGSWLGLTKDESRSFF